MAETSENRRIIGLMVVGPNEADRYLQNSLNQFKKFCDDAMIVLNNADKKTEQMVKKSGFHYYKDEREWGKEQPLIKTDLLKRIGSELNPDWILALDSDEVFEDKMTREKFNELTTRGHIGYYFYLVNLWTDEHHYAPSESFWNIRFYKYAPAFGINFERKNLHCGLGPPIVYSYGAYAPYIVRHYGLMKEEDRKKKVERYKKYDPNAVFKGRVYYDMLARGSREVDYNEEDVHLKVVEEVSRYGTQNKKIKENMDKKFAYVKRRKDGKVLDIPASDLDETLKHGFDFVGWVELSSALEAPVIKKEATPMPLVCPICGFEAKNDFGMKAHKRKHK
jgi:hypothetical protein